MILYITILPASSPASSDNGSSPPSFFSCLQGPSIPCTTFFLTTVRGGKTPHNILHHNYLIRPSQCITFQRYGHPSPPLYPPITSLTSLISNGCFPSLVTRLCIPRLIPPPLTKSESQGSSHLSGCQRLRLSLSPRLCLVGPVLDPFWR